MNDQQLIRIAIKLAMQDRFISLMSLGADLGIFALLLVWIICDRCNIYWRKPKSRKED